MSARTYLSLGLIAAALVLGWRILAPASNSASEQAAGGAATLVDTVTRAQFTAAEATLSAQRSATGSYAGAAVEPPLRLVRSDATSFCLELARGSTLVHLAGPGGDQQPGACL